MTERASLPLWPSIPEQDAMRRTRGDTMGSRPASAPQSLPFFVSPPSVLHETTVPFWTVMLGGPAAAAGAAADALAEGAMLATLALTDAGGGTSGAGARACALAEADAAAAAASP